MKKIITGVAAAAVLASGGYYLASPYMVIKGLETAVINGDSDKVIASLNLPSIKTSFKKQGDVLVDELFDGFEKQLGHSQKLNDSKKYIQGSMGGFIDKALTHSAIEHAIRSEKMSSKKAFDLSKANITYNYKGLNTFQVEFYLGKSTLLKAQILMQRKGFSNWEVYDVQLPVNDIQKAVMGYVEQHSAPMLLSMK